MMFKKWYTLLLTAVLVITMLSSGAILSVSAAGGPSLQTTLQDHVIQKGSKKTFDVWARNASGQKIKATVKFNGKKLSPTWDDNEKTSYTLLFTQEGENIVEVFVSSDGGQKQERTYHITYQKAKPGEKIGKAFWSVEAFTLGAGYIIEPVQMDIYEGETAADQLIRLLHQNGLVAYHGGKTKTAFYLAYIADGTAPQSSYSGYAKSGTAISPRALRISPSIPALLIPYLEKDMTYFEPQDYIQNWEGYLGEFVITNGSGWMYCVNNVFPNVGFSDTFLTDGDVVRVQFTMAYGADIGGAAAVGGTTAGGESMPSGFYSVADKDKLTVAIANAKTSGLLSKATMKQAYAAALKAVMTLNISQSALDAATKTLEAAFVDPGSEGHRPATAPVSPQPGYSGQASYRPAGSEGGVSGQTGSLAEHPKGAIADGKTAGAAGIRPGGTGSAPSAADTTRTAGDGTGTSFSATPVNGGTVPVDGTAPGGDTSDGPSGWRIVGWIVALVVIAMAGGGTAFVLLRRRKCGDSFASDTANPDDNA